MSAFSLHGTVSVDTRKARAELESLRGVARHTRDELDKMARDASQSSGRASREAGRVQVQSAKQAASQSLSAQQQADRQGAQSARQGSQQRAQADRDAARAAVQTTQQASRQQFQAQQQGDRLAAQSARDTARAQERAQEQATRAALQSARDQQRANERTALEAQREAQQTQRAQERAANAAARAAERSSREQQKAQQKATDETVRQLERENRAREKARAVAQRQRASQVKAGKQAAGELADQGSQAATVGGLAIVASAAVSVKVLEDYDRQLRNVNSIAQLSEPNLQKLSGALLKMSADPQIRKGPTDLTKGLYDVYSVGFKGAEALDILRDSAKGAAAGNTDTAVAVDALTGTLKAQIVGATNSRQVMDSLFQTVNDGKVEFPQLAEAIGQTLPFLKSGGVSLQEYGAYMADATAKSQKAAFATNNLNNLISKLAAPPAAAAKEFEKLGIKTGFAELKSKGFAAKMAEIIEKTKGSDDALKALFPDMQAFTAAQTIGSNKMAGFNAMLENQKRATQGVGATARAAAKQNQGLANDIDQAKKSAEIFAITAAQVLAPSVSAATKRGTELLQSFQALSPETQQIYVKTALLAGGLLLLGGRLKSVIETGILIGKVFRGMSAAMEAARAAKLASAAASGTLAVADTQAAAAAAALAESEGAAGAGAASAAVGTASFGAAFVALAAVAVVATAAIGAYKINQEAVAEHNARLKASNADLVASNRATALSFDVLRKSASADAGASKTVSDLAGQYERLKGSAAGLEKFKNVALPAARREIAVNVHLTMPQKAELNGQIDQVASQIDGNIRARKFNVQVTAEADQGALANVREAFFRAYGELYSGLKGLFYDPAAAGAQLLWSELKSGATGAGVWIKGEWDGMLSHLDSATSGAASKLVAKIQEMMNAIGKAIADKAAAFSNWYNGRSANYGETDGPGLPATPPSVQGAPKSDIWKAAHGLPVGGTLPSYDVGTNYVPMDQIAQVHKGEIIIPAAQSEKIRGRKFDLQNRIDTLDSKIDGRNLSLARAGNKQRDPQLRTWRAERQELSGELAQLKREITDADRDQKARTKGQRDDLRAAAKDYAASAKQVQDTIEKTLDHLSKLRDGFKGLFEGAQSELAGLGDVSNPLASRVGAWERFLKLAQSASAAVNAGNSVIGTQPLGNAPTGAQTGTQTDAPTRASKAGARSLFERYNLKSTVDMTCADVASRTIEGLGIAIKKSVNAGQLEKNVKAAGWVRVDPRTAPIGSAVFKDSPTARSGVHAMMGLGDGQLASSSNHKTSYFRARGSERAYAPPSAAQGGARSYAGDFANGFSGKRFEMGDYSLSSYRALGAGWGGGVRQNDDNRNRFALQSKLASGEMEAQIAQITERLKDKAATAKLLAQTGFTLKSELPLREQAISLLRQEANAQDVATNARRHATEAADKANATLKELNKARRAVGTEKNPLAPMLAEFESGGQYAGAPNKKAALLDGQMSLSLAQIVQSTKDASDAEHARAAALREVAPLLNQTSLQNGDYDRALEKVNRRFEVWKSPDLSGLLDAAKSYDGLANAALKAANAIANKPGKLTNAERADYNRLKAQAAGYTGRAAGARRQANEQATVRVDAGNAAANDALDQEQTKKFFQQSEASAASLGQRGSDAFKTLKNALKDSGQSAADLRGVLADIDPLLADLPGISEKSAAVSALAARRGQAELASLTDEARLARAQTALTLQYAPDNPQLERELVMLGERNRLTLEYNKLSLEGRNGFNLDGKVAAFAENFDAAKDLSNAQTYRALMSEAAQATALFGDESATAGIKYRAAFGDLKGMPAGWKAEMIDATAVIARVASATDALQSAKNQRIDLQKQQLEGLATWFNSGRALSGVQQQEIDWKFEDARYNASNPDKPRTAQETADINKERFAVRGLMRDWDEFSAKRDKAQQMAQGISGAFMSGFDAVLARQGSFEDAFMTSLQNMLVESAKQVIQSKLTSALLGLFGGGVSSVPGIVPISGAAAAQPVGVHAGGLDRVPRDNYLALLHANEKVMSAGEAESWRQQEKAKDIATSASAWRRQQERDGAMALSSRAGSGSASSGAGGGNTHIHFNAPVTVKSDKPEKFVEDLGASLPKREMRRRGRAALGI